MEIKRLYNRNEENAANGFSILKYSSPESDMISTQPMHWVLCVDRSGSMETIGSKDQRSRMDHVKATVVRIVEYLKQLCEGTTRVYYVDVVWFNGEVTTTSITVDKLTDLSEFISEVNSVGAAGLTNMSAAIKKASSMIMEAAPIKSAMVLLSDGEITAGVSDPQYLIQWVNECADALKTDFAPVFVGYGTEQSSSLLMTLSRVPNGEYHCVESVEGASIVYGEIVHGVLYESIKNLNIEVQGGQIYNFEKNSWESSLHVGKVAAGASRVWHLRESGEEPLSVNATYDTLTVGEGSDKDSWIQESVSCATVEEPAVGASDKECYRYFLRQEVLELLAEAKEYTENMHERMKRNTPPPAPRVRRQDAGVLPAYSDIEYGAQHQDLFDPPPVLSPIRIAGREAVKEEKTPGQKLREKLMVKLGQIKEYIAAEGDDTGMLGALCDDLYICSLALKSSRGLTYIIARQTSQGLQRAYNATGMDDLEEDEDDGAHEISNSMVSPYASQRLGAVIREVSQAP